jgi:hypothetical protein
VRPQTTERHERHLKNYLTHLMHQDCDQEGPDRSSNAAELLLLKPQSRRQPLAADRELELSAGFVSVVSQYNGG